MNSKNRFILSNLLVFEFILLNLVLLTYLFFSLPEFSLFETRFLSIIAALTFIYNISWLFIILYIRDKEFYFSSNYGYLKSILISLFFFVGLVTTMVIVFKIRYFARSTFIIPIFIFSYLNLIGHKYLLQYLKKRGAHLFSNTLLIGSVNELTNLKAFPKEMAHYGYNIIGYLKDHGTEADTTLHHNVLGNIDELNEVLSKNSIDEIFIGMCALEQEKITELIRIADNFGIRVKLIPENPLLIAKNYKAVTLGNLVFFKLRQSPLDNFSMTMVKRMFDFCFALLVILVFSPLYLLICLLIFMDSRGSILYTPDRKGEAGKTFKCYKFRTMSICDNPHNGTRSTLVNDPRITRIGRIIRKADLDELPQFFNVLKGEMSVIGPRPHRSYLQDDFRKSVKDYMVRGYVKPGITGWAQVNGWRGPTVTDEQKNERIRHDLWYIENWSFWLDIQIVFLTLFGRHRKKAF